MITETNLKRTVKIYAATTLFCITLNYVYSFFGHGVNSTFMTYAFAFSLVLGVGGFLLLGRLKLEHRIAFNLYNAGIATLTVGSVLRGILDIAGADVIYPVYYFIVGTIFVAVGVLLYLSQWIKSFKKIEA